MQCWLNFHSFRIDLDLWYFPLSLIFFISRKPSLLALLMLCPVILFSETQKLLQISKNCCSGVSSEHWSFYCTFRQTESNNSPFGFYFFVECLFYCLVNQGLTKPMLPCLPNSNMHNGHNLCDHKNRTMAASLQLMIHEVLHELIFYALNEGSQDVCSYSKTFPLPKVLPCQIPYTNHVAYQKNLKGLDLWLLVTGNLLSPWQLWQQCSFTQTWAVSS